jgi:hypothetical protein
VVAPDDADIASAIGRVCAEEPDMRSLLARVGESGPLDRFLAAVRGTGDLTATTTALHAALQRSGDARGILGGVRTATPWGMGDARPVDVVLLCPRRRCTRAEAPSQRSARCALFDEPLRPERI